MYRNDSLVEPSLVVLCSSSSLEFQKTHPQHSEPPKMEDSIYRLHVFMVRSNICRKCPNMQCSKKFTSHAYHTIWCCRNPQGQQPRNVNKNPCCYMGRISTTILPQLGFRWSRISFSKKPQRYALKTLLLCHARVFRRKLRRVTRLRFSFGLGEEVALLQGRQNVPTVGIHGKDPEMPNHVFFKWMANGDFSIQQFFPW